MNNLTLVITTYIIIALILSFIVLSLIKRKRLNKYKEELETLDREKNEIASAPIMSELAKLETIVKNEKIEEKYKQWIDAFELIKTREVPKINDMIIDLDIYMDKRKRKDYLVSYAKAELAIYKARALTDTLLDDIREINLSEEKYRSIITKLKTKYRELLNIFEEKKNNYENIASVIELQFENIERRFQDFEEYMETNDYQEVFHIVKGIDIMVDHMGIVIEEVPDLVLLANRLIPKKIEQITELYEDLKAKKYPLKHLKIEYNVSEALKNINMIIDRIKVLNLENCMFELKTMLEYLDSIFEEFERERLAKKQFEDAKEVLDNKLTKAIMVVTNIYEQLEDIRNMYDLKEEDIKSIDNINNTLNEVNLEYQALLKDLNKRKVPYSEAKSVLERNLDTIKLLEVDLDIGLKNLGNMYEDEVRAREQLDEIQEFLKHAKIKMRSYKLPVISNNYFVELQEANEAIYEIIKELEKKPITIKILNLRVDTARDLVLKLYNTTNEMIKTARLAEYSLIYGNRYRSENINVEHGLNQAEQMFNKGNYKKALETTILTIERIDSTIRERVKELYERSE